MAAGQPNVAQFSPQNWNGHNNMLCPKSDSTQDDGFLFLPNQDNMDLDGVLIHTKVNHI